MSLNVKAPFSAFFLKKITDGGCGGDVVRCVKWLEKQIMWLDDRLTVLSLQCQ